MAWLHKLQLAVDVADESPLPWDERGPALMSILKNHLQRMCLEEMED